MTTDQIAACCGHADPHTSTLNATCTHPGCGCREFPARYGQQADPETVPGLLSVLRLAVSDPGKFTPRQQHSHGQELDSHWQARAAAKAAEPFLAKPAELSDSERFQVEEARRMLTSEFMAQRLPGDEIYGTERTLFDHARNLLDLVDRIARKGEAGE